MSPTLFAKKKIRHLDQTSKVTLNDFSLNGSGASGHQA
jgi:hypothetical protein